MANGFIPGAGLGAPGQREKFGGGAKENFTLVLKQTAALIALGVWSVVIAATALWIIGPVLPKGIIAGGCLIAGYIGVRFVKNYLAEPSWAIAIVAVVTVSSWMLLSGVQIVADNWPVSCTWRWEAKVIVLACQAVVLEALWLARYRFKYEIVDPKAQPTFKPREVDSIRWPESPLPSLVEGLYEELDNEPSRPLPTPGDESVMIVNPASRSALSPNAAFAADLRDFVSLGSTRGFSRGAWIVANTPRTVLTPTRNQVTRGYYDKMLGYLREGGIVTSGDAPELTVSLERALAAINAPPHPAAEGGQAEL